jgi:hypothetical protein
MKKKTVDQVNIKEKHLIQTIKYHHIILHTNNISL